MSGSRIHGWLRGALYQKAGIRAPKSVLAPIEEQRQRRLLQYPAAPKAAPKAAPAAAPKAAGGAGSVKIEAGAAGKVFKLEKKAGDAVKKGDAVVIIEAMKMEIPVVAPQDGTVASVDVAVGDAVEAGAVLATMN